MEVLTFQHTDDVSVWEPSVVHSETAQGRFYRLPNGSVVPSITTVLSRSKNDALDEWRNRIGIEEADKISRIAARRGEDIHQLIEKYLNNEMSVLKIRSLMPDYKSMILNALPILNKINDIRHQEVSLYSQTLGIAGRVDLIANFDSVLSVIDFKTSDYIKENDRLENYYIQTTAYSLMYQELTGIEIDDLVIISLNIFDNETTVKRVKRQDYIEKLNAVILNYYSKENQ